MPIGIITDVCATFVGSVLGILIGKKLPDYLKTALNNILGMAAITMGVVLIMRQHALSAVVLSAILGCITGEVLKLETVINKGVSKVTAKLMKGQQTDENYLIQVSAVVVLFCFGGTGWYGALNEGITGDSGILITKSILDLVTATIFGSILGKIVPALCVPQALVYAILFLVSGLVKTLITPEMISDFSAVGGIITLCAGLRLSGIKKDIKVLNLLPGLIIAFFISALWTAVIG
ncbi:MAG: DUF554 domain-containing protein [Lachnospiraceae bacterium]|nr:DUF554 domain-containing protein [Lachnospiraceae bacterium]